MQNEYIEKYKSIFTDVDALGAAWQGKDNQEYVAAIKSYEPAFKKMADFLNGTSQFLKEAATAYQETQDAVKTAASSIANK